MSLHLVIAVADALVAQINASPLVAGGSVPPAQRHYRPQFDLAELKTTRLSVVPKAVVISGLARGSNLHDVAVDVALQKKLATADAAELDPLMGVMQELADLLRLSRLTAMPTAVWVQTENSPVYALEHLDNQRVFTSLLTVTYRVMR
jgi:hypothetical protein